MTLFTIFKNTEINIVYSYTHIIWCYYSWGVRAETGVAIVVNISIMIIVVMKIVCNDKIIASKLKAKPVNILLEQVYMATAEYEDDEVEELHDIV
jgi:hypothetical protein